jgi:glycosyltransferase involved in cell wall biosynthesis
VQSRANRALGKNRWWGKEKAEQEGQRNRYENSPAQIKDANSDLYPSFIGRIVPIKGTHLAIEVAKRTGIPLKIAGEVQPVNREYSERKIKPEIGGSLVEYIGPANLEAKNELLGNSMAMSFPIQWNEPFGLVMVEAMACDTPVLAMPAGSAQEVVRDGISAIRANRLEKCLKWCGI